VGAERDDQAVPGSKQAVDGARRVGRFGGDSTHRQRFESAFGDCVFAGGE